MKFFFTIICVLGCSSIFGQQYEYVYKNQNDSSFHCYLKVFPTTKTIRGLVIRDYSALPDINEPSPYQFTAICAQEGLMTLYTTSSNQFPELFINDSAMGILDEMVAEVIQKHNIPPQHIFIGGISSSGTRAFRYAQYCEQGKSRHGVKIKSVFAVDAPLDLARFYHSVHEHEKHFKEGMAWEAELMKKVFSKLFQGLPEQYNGAYQKASVFTHSDSLGGNAQLLKNLNVILFHEPDIEWWLNERGASYMDINSYDIAAFALCLKYLGNKNVELVTTTQKGYDRKGNRNCHSWSIVDETYLLNWITKQLK